MFGSDDIPNPRYIPLIPEAAKLGDLFDDVAPWVGKEEGKNQYLVLDSEHRIKVVEQKPSREDWMAIGTYLTIRPGAGMPETFPHIQSLRVTPNQRLVDVLLHHMVFIDYDTIYFEMIVFPDRCDLYYKHNRITGGRMLTKALQLNGDPMAAIIALSELSD